MDDDTESSFSPEKINEIEHARLQSLEEYGINEDDVISMSKKHVNMWNSAFSDNITRGKDDMQFVIKDQWTSPERGDFTRLFKPAMTFNKLYDSVKKVIGEARKNKPDLMVRSLNGKASQQDITLRSDILRTIAYRSQNDLVYQSAFRSALLMSFGAIQVKFDYESHNSFKKIPSLELVPDSTRCYFDATALKPHKGDGNYCGIIYTITLEEFNATYPNVLNPVSFPDLYTLLDFQWTNKDTINVNDYFVKEWYPTVIHKLSNGDTVTEKQWEEMQKRHKESIAIVSGAVSENIIRSEIPQIDMSRMSEDYRIMHYRVISNQILEFEEWPSKHLPVIFVDGDSSYMEGRQYTRSFIRDARDAQKFVNYVGSEIAAEIKNRRREQWIGTPDNIVGYEQEWRNPEIQIGMLRAKPDPKTSQMPQKLPPWDLSAGLLQHFQRGSQDIREILGFSETEQLQGRDVSGKARRERKLEGAMSAYVYYDNLNQAIEQVGRVILDLIPAMVGDDEHPMVITKKDGKTKPIVINKRDENGKIKNQITPGDFDVEIDAGPSFAVQKEIALEFFQQTISNDPQVFNLVADLWASNLDIEQMEQVKERLSSLVPPEILAKEQGKPLPPKQLSPQEQMMQAEMQSKQAEIQLKQKDLELKAQKLQLESEQNELNKAKMLLEAQKVQSENQLNLLDHQLNVEKAKITHGLDHKVADQSFSTDIAKILADVYKHENPQKTSSEQ